jgi:superfamily II DNA/RNA helicase
VIQYDFPEDETSFYQQAGRVARIGKPTAEGTSILQLVVSLVTVNDMPLLEQISLRLD